MSSQRRPRTITELAGVALSDLKGEPIFKNYLRKAEKEWKDGRRLADQGDLENAYIALVKAAKIILEMMPMHPSYNTEISSQQQGNLAENGRQILTTLETIKPVLMERQTRWVAEQENAGRQGAAHEQTHPVGGGQQRSDPPSFVRTRPNLERPPVEDITSRMQDLRAGDPRGALHRQQSMHRDSPGNAVEATLAAARQAATVTTDIRTPTHSANPSPIDQPWGNRDERDRAWRQENGRATRELRQEELERRLKEADQKAEMIRQTIAANHPGVSYNYSTPISPAPSIHNPHHPQPPPQMPPTTSGLHYPSTPMSAQTTPMNNRSSHLSEPMEPTVRPMPLQRPFQFDDTNSNSTDSESVTEWSGPVAKPRGSIEYTRVPTFPSTAIYSPPTASSHPNAAASGRITYPQIMSQHQKSQGYRPDLPYPQALPSHPHHRHDNPQQLTYHVPSIRYPAYPGPSRAAPPLPPPAPHHASANRPAAQRPPTERIPAEKQLPPGALRRVNLPKAIIHRFLQLARANTTLNLETCGLLLGKPKGATKFVVTTLLVPKQHSTSDTCTMDEEELVIAFTEERELVTLGWIHTHPSQSCFMSSVDLHTHSGFQMMLQESFAVVCAPRSEPNFGIFRLTDPPGLQVIKDCKAKEAFHPHPDLPIYTDADKGHVRMKEIPLEIVDLR